MRPIVQQVLDREKTLLAELRCALYKLGCVPRHIKQLRVDSMTLQPGRRLSKEVLAYRALHPSGAPVWKAEKLPSTSPTLITDPPESFNPIVEGKLPEPRGWEDMTAEAARDWVLGGGSIMVAGLPGTGKSFLVMQWVAELTRKVYLTGPTHVSCRNLRVEGLEPMTLQRFWNRHLKLGSGLHKDCTLVIDECSQVNTLMWHRLAPLARLCQVIVMGNPEDQLLAVADSWLDVPLEVDVSETQLLRSMCSYRRLRLTEGKRSCRELWDLYSSMATTGWRYGQPLAEMIEAARALPRLHR